MPSKNAGLAKAYGKPRNPPPKVPPRPKARASGPKRKGGNSDSTVVKRLICDKICAVCDPTCQSACGAKMMGKDSSRTFSFTHKSVVTLTTNSSGKTATWLSPGIEGVMSVPSVLGAGNVVTWDTATDLPEAASLQASASSYRVVSAGFRLFSTASPTNSSGRVQVTQTNVTGDGTPTGFDVTSLLYEEVNTDSLYAYDKTFCFRREGAEAEIFEPASNTSPHDGWNGIVISITGAAASTAVMQLELTFNLELQPDPITIYSRMADPPAKHVPVLESAIANVSKHITFGGDTETWPRKVMNFAATEASALIAQYGAKDLLALLV